MQRTANHRLGHCQTAQTPADSAVTPQADRRQSKELFLPRGQTVAPSRSTPPHCLVRGFADGILATAAHGVSPNPSI